MLQAPTVSQNVLVLSRFSDVSATTIFSKSLLFRSAFIAALIALIYGLQLWVDHNQTEPEASRAAVIDYYLPSSE